MRSGKRGEGTIKRGEGGKKDARTKIKPDGRRRGAFPPPPPPSHGFYFQYNVYTHKMKKKKNPKNYTFDFRVPTEQLRRYKSFGFSNFPPATTVPPNPPPPPPLPPWSTPCRQIFDHLRKDAKLHTTYGSKILLQCSNWKNKNKNLRFTRRFYILLDNFQCFSSKIIISTRV